MVAVRTKSQTVILLASVLVSGCRFFPEQLLLPGQPKTDQSDAGVSVRPSAMASAVSGAGRGADPAAPRPTSGGSMAESSPATAAGSGAADGGASPMDAGIASIDASVGMNTAPDAHMTSAGSSAPAAAGSGASGTGSEDKPKQAQDPTCDLSGVWITKQVAASKALEEVGFNNGYGYYEIEQSGTDFVVKKHIDCGGQGLGSGTAFLSRASLQAITQHNSQSGRKGRFALVDGKCTLEVAHFWSVRGAEETRFLPDPRDSTMSLAELQKLKPLPTQSKLDGAEDWENDGQPGVATQLSGIVSGARNGCARDWDRWFTEPGYEITPSLNFTSDLKVRFAFEAEEIVLAPRSGLLTIPSEFDGRYVPIMRFRFLGRTTDDPRAQAIIKADPVETCYAVQDAIPAEMLTR